MEDCSDRAVVDWQSAIICNGEMPRGGSPDSILRKRRRAQPTQNESHRGNSGCRLFHSVRASLNCAARSAVSGSSGLAPSEYRNFILTPNRSSSELDILEMEPPVFPFSGARVPVMCGVNSNLSTTAIVQLLSSISHYHYPLASEVRHSSVVTCVKTRERYYLLTLG